LNHRVACSDDFRRQMIAEGCLLTAPQRRRLLPAVRPKQRREASAAQDHAVDSRCRLYGPRRLSNRMQMRDRVSTRGQRQAGAAEQLGRGQHAGSRDAPSLFGQVYSVSKRAWHHAVTRAAKSACQRLAAFVVPSRAASCLACKVFRTAPSRPLTTLEQNALVSKQIYNVCCR
jgi:hypothetical protein